jgi:hypothetical protein
MAGGWQIHRMLVELGNPATGRGNSNVLQQATFGTITSTRNNMRQIQFGLKYNF